MRSLRPAARPAATVGFLLMLALLAGCGQPAPPATPPDPPATGSPTPSGDALQRRLADALRTQGDASGARLVEDRSTTVTAVPADWLVGWQVVDVLHRGVPHGRRFFVGLAADGRVEHLAGRADAFSAMVTASGVEVTDPTTATATARLFLDATRTFAQYAYRVESVADVQWSPRPDEAGASARRRLARTYRARIAPPEPREVREGWQLTLWTVDGRTLVEHAVVVSRDGRVSDVARTAEPDLPVPSSR